MRLSVHTAADQVRVYTRRLGNQSTLKNRAGVSLKHCIILLSLITLISVLI